MPKKLLLADDSITIQKVIGITFANEDFTLTTVDNGVDAIQTARRIRPDLILADVVMPGKNGYEVCEYVKHDPELRNTPVLLLAGTFESFDEAEMARVGADGYITKPFESQTLIDKVHELTSRAQTPGGRPPAQPGASGPPPARTAAAVEPDLAEADSSFNLDDFSPFEEVAPEAAVQEGDADWDAQNGSGAEEDVWDLSDFEPGTEPALDAGVAGIEGEQTFDFAESEATEPAAEADAFGDDDPLAAPDLLEPVAEDEGFGSTDEGFGSTDDGFGGNGELAAELMEVAEAAPDEDAFAADPEFAEVAEIGDGADLAEVADDSMELTDFEEVADEALEAEALEAVEEDPLAAPPEADEDGALVPADGADDWQVESVTRVGAAPVPMGALASRVRAAAEGLAGDLEAAGVTLPPAQIEAIVTRVAREVIESVAWEVVPDLCEQLITAEIRKLTGK
ncbi:MAG TPA: response regulator [Thermodesulfobacteriota bacterium]